MNREQRRLAAKLAKNPPKRNRSHWGTNAPMLLLEDSAPFKEGELTLDHIKIRMCFVRLQDGTGDWTDFNKVAVAINLAKQRALDIDEVLADKLEVAQDAMNRCKERFEQYGRFGFDGPGLQAVIYAIDANEEIVKNSSRMQMVRATREVNKVLRGKAKDGECATAIFL